MQSTREQGFHPENIPGTVSQFRTDNQVPVLSKETFRGGQCHIFKADFPDGESWAIRIPLYMQSDSRDIIISTVKCEVDVLQELELKGFRWASKFKGCSLTYNNSVGFPFIVLSWIVGRPLSWSENYPPRPLRNKILSQIALIQESLIECTKENRGPATKYFERVTNNRLRRVRDGHLPNLTEQDCFRQKALLPLVLYLELEDAPFAIDHGDLSPLNMIVDSEHNIMGIIDWGFAAMVPVQIACGFPRLLYSQPPDLPPSLTLQEDRQSFTSSLLSRSSEAISWMCLVQSPKDVDFRLCFLESILSKGMHAWLVLQGWRLPYCDLIVNQNKENKENIAKGKFVAVERDFSQEIVPK